MKSLNRLFEQNRNRLWLSFFGIWLILLSGLLDFWLQSPGLKQWFKVQSTLRDRRHEITEIEAKTEVLHEVSRQLDSNAVAQEREIRKVLGYLGEQEVVFEFNR